MREIGLIVETKKCDKCLKIISVESRMGKDHAQFVRNMFELTGKSRPVKDMQDADPPTKLNFPSTADIDKHKLCRCRRD